MTRKRKNIDDETESKPQQVNPFTDIEIRRKKKLRRSDLYDSDGMIIKNNWFSASSVHNYILNDPILDWLKQISSNRGYTPDPSESQFATYLMRKGVEFEAAVMKYLENKLGPGCIVKICTDYQQIPSEQKYLETIDAMKRGAIVIYQGALHNATNQTYGSPDLLVRSDYIDKIVIKSPISRDEARIGAPLLKYKNKIPKYHYRVIDIKFCTLKLTADGVGLLNSGRNTCNKAQIMIYNEALGIAQGYTPPTCYIMGRGYTYRKFNNTHKGSRVDDRLGSIDVFGADEFYKEKIKHALEWLSDLRANGRHWQVTPEPDREELYPNMSNHYDAPYHKVKSEIAKELDEITLLWQCGPKHRKRCLSLGIKKYTDKRCSAQALGHNGKKNGTVVQRMLDFNHGVVHPHDKVIPRKIFNNFSNWRQHNRYGGGANDPSCKLEFYIDYENVNNIIDDFSTLPRSSTTNIVFMIGLGYADPNTNAWIYKSFVAADLSTRSEYKIFDDFHKYVAGVQLKYNEPNPNFYHWGHVEQSLYDSIKETHGHTDNNNVDNWVRPNFVDFLKVFHDEIILVKGALNFSLKTIAVKMAEHSLISSTYKDLECENGIGAIVTAINAYNESKTNQTNVRETAAMQSIIKYNAIDCKVIYEIIRYLRKNHSADTTRSLARAIFESFSWFPQWILDRFSYVE